MSDGLMFATEFRGLTPLYEPQRQTDHRFVRTLSKRLIILVVLTTSALLRASAALQDFAGSEACARCHEKQYKLWKDSTHRRAGGKTDEVKMIARFDGQPLRFKDAKVTPRANPQGEYEFIVEEPGQPELAISVDAVVGGGHMFGGGTQSFFHRFINFFMNDETTRCGTSLPRCSHCPKQTSFHRDVDICIF